MREDATRALALWHLLSLDAPTVAALWTWFIARSCRIHLPVVAILAMAVAVWTLYVADRLLDAQLAGREELEARHYFHGHHRFAFLVGITAASILLATLLPRLSQEAIRLYLILGGFVFGYFVIIHATESARRLPKEIAVGICFASAVFIPTVSRDPNLRRTLLPAALLFASLCSLNCLFIYAWEHPSPTGTVPHTITRFALKHLPALSLLVCGLAIAFATTDSQPHRLICFPIAMSVGCLLLLHRNRSRSSPLMLRSAADFVLLTPLLFIAFL